LDDDILNTIFDSAIKNKNIIKNRQVLTIDYVPDKLLFRTKESTAIAQSLSVILKKGPSNLLIFGKPGTGKTAVVKNVIEHLYNKTNQLDINLRVPFINAKNSNTPYKILYEIAELLGINKEERKMQVYFTGLSMSEATDRILDFIRRRSIRVVLVIDEIDSLVNRKGDDIL
jgi:cell division control protein 6